MFSFHLLIGSRLTANINRQGKADMKLPLGVGFALLLMLQSFQNVCAEEIEILNENTTSPEDLVTGYSSTSLSGDGESQFTNHTSEGMSVMPVAGVELGDTESVTSIPPPYMTLNSSSELSVENNDTSTQKANSSKPLTPEPDLRPPMVNGTDLNNTVTEQPETNSTGQGSARLPKNETSTDTFDTQNSTTNATNSTTTGPPHHTNTTTMSLPKNPANGTNQTTTTWLPANESTTIQLYPVTTQANKTGGSFNVRENKGRGLASDIKQKAKNQAWGAILCVGVAVGIVSLVVYVIMKRRSHRNFSHRKLVEETAPDPVLRLDNNGPMDLKYDGFAYYNPGLQGDNIQMTSFPRGHSN